MVIIRMIADETESYISDDDYNDDATIIVIMIASFVVCRLSFVSLSLVVSRLSLCRWSFAVCLFIFCRLSLCHLSFASLSFVICRLSLCLFVVSRRLESDALRIDGRTNRA